MPLNLLAMNGWDSFVRLFTEMDAIVAVLFILGIIFSTIEIFVPGFGFFGITGVILFVAGIVIRMINGGDALMLLYMLLIAGVFFIVCFWILSKSATKGRLSKTGIFNIGTAVPEDKTEGTKDFSYLLGKTGKTVTVLRPVGRARFDRDIVDVIALEGFIAEGEIVEVIETEGQRVVVKQFETEEN